MGDLLAILIPLSLGFVGLYLLRRRLSIGHSVAEANACIWCRDTGRNPRPEVRSLSSRRTTNSSEETCGHCEIGSRLRKKLETLDHLAFAEWKAQVRHDDMTTRGVIRPCISCGDTGVTSLPMVLPQSDREPTEHEKCCDCLAGVRRRRQLRKF